MTKISQVNKKIPRKIATNQILVCIGSLIQPALFKEIPATNSKTLACTGMQASLIIKRNNKFFQTFKILKENCQRENPL